MDDHTLELLARRYNPRAASRSARQEHCPQVPAKRRQPGQPGLISRVIGVLAAVTMTTLVVGSQLGLVDHYGLAEGEVMAGNAATSWLG